MAPISYSGIDGVDAPDGINVPEWWCCRPLKEASVNQVSTIGLDLAKHIFQVHGADSAGCVVLRKKLRRGEVLSFFSTLPPCGVAMEACGSAHYWGREIAKLGHTVRLIAPAYVKPFVKRQKNDAADAEAICEAAQRPTMRFVAVKSEQVQAASLVFRTRDLLVRQRTQVINALRGHLTLQLHLLLGSESMGNHDSEIMDGRLDRDDAGALGVLAAGREGADQAVVHASAGGDVGGFVPGRFARG